MSPPQEAEEDIDVGGVALEKGLDINDLERGTTFDIKPTSDDYSDFHDEFFEEDMLKYSKAELLAVDDDEEEEDLNKSPFEKLAEDMADMSPNNDRKLLKRLMRPGIGGSLPESALVRIHYNAYFDCTAEPFDSTYLRNRPQTFRLGEYKVLPALELGVATMKLKEKSQFLCAPEFGFGERGCPPRIPENATILFEVELLSILDNVAAVDFSNLSQEEQASASFAELMKAARGEHATGNDFHRQKNYFKAEKSYRRGITLLENATYPTEKEEEEGNHVLLKLYLNLSQVAFSLGKYRTTCKYGNLASNIDRTNTKAYFWIGRACTQMCDWKRARECLSKAQRRQPDNPEIWQALQLLDDRKKDSDAKEKTLYRKMFKAFKPVEKKVAPIEDDSFRQTVKEAMENIQKDSNPHRSMTFTQLNPNELACAEEIAKLFEGLEVNKTSDSIKISKTVKEA